ncbi:tetratricopeptide repeat protein [Acidaminobacter sp. JC074]|uniref:ATP-binding protein n=1 Tax=Acidaminobacter sp. JC074 TaxID=2530199 RepID=UPI001F103A51|nr:ATP-binding protein [Acidaminobacter sp. JC074]MCH4889748.1 tetratricopeptide repeat protein [Acidaminobacter sp. JC074]
MYRDQIEKAWNDRRHHPEASHKIIKEILNKAMPDSLDYHNALTVYGILEIYFADYHEAEKALIHAGDYYEKHHDPLFESRNDNSLGMMYINSGDLSKAVTYLMHGVEVADKHDIDEMFIYMVYNLGEIYKDIKNYSKAITFIKKAIDKNPSESHSITSVLYSSMAQCLEAVNEYEKAMVYADKSIEIAANRQDDIALALCYITLAHLYFNMNKLDLAYDYCLKSYDIRTRINDLYSIVVCHMVFARIAHGRKNYLECIYRCEMALEISNRIKSSVNHVVLYELLATSCKHLKKFNEAIYYYEKLKEYQKKHFNDELQNNVTVMSAENNIESLKKDAEIYMLSNEKLIQKSKELKLISNIGQTLINVLDFKIVTEELYKHLSELLNIQFMSIGILNEDELDYTYIVYDNEFLIPYRVKDKKKSFGYKAISEKRTITLSKEDLQLNNIEQIKDISKINSLLFCPLYNHNKAIGVISIQSYDVDAYSISDIDLVEGLSSYIAIAIDNALKTSIIKDTADELRRTLDNLRETQASLIQAEKLAAMGSLVAGVAHELNTPIGASITMITHQIDLIKSLQKQFLSETLSKKQLSDCINKSLLTLNNIEDAVIHSSDMINSFKSLAINKTDILLKQIEINHLLQLVYKNEEKLLMDNDVHLTTNHSSDFIKTYPTILLEVLHQLIANSIHHSFEDEDRKIISLFVELKEDGIHIIYKDSGKDIPEDVQSHMYEPFYSTKKLEGMMGIGLHAVHNMVTQLLDGVIYYDKAYTITIPNIETN